MKLDLGKILQSINKGSKPSTDTLFVSDKNDQRLKAYQDSLSTYNKNVSQKQIDDILKYGQYKRVKSDIPGAKIQPLESYEPDTKKMDELTASGVPYTYLSPSVPLSKEMAKKYYVDEYNQVRSKESGKLVTSYGNVYKKPVQPVVYREAKPDTLFVSDKNNPRLKAYQDSLKLYNRYQSDLKNRGNKVEASFKAEDEILGPIKNSYAKNKIKPTRVDWYSSGYGGRGDAFIPVYKKPIQPVEYREEVKKKEEPKTVLIKREAEQAVQNKYEGRPVYYPTVGSGGPSALVGFSNNADTTFIKPEDFDRFAVPKYAREFIKSRSKKK